MAPPSGNAGPATTAHMEDEAQDATEETPLLSNDLPPSVAPPTAYQHKVVFLCMALFLILIIGDYLQVPPQQAILEEVICREFHPEKFTAGNETEGDDLCKDNDVQGKLAMIRGWDIAFQTIPPLVVTVPYGVIADKYGRQPVLFLSMLGLFLQLGWVQFPLRWPNIFPIWTIWLSSLFQFIGGGATMLGAMVWTMLADVVPVAHRTTIYFRVVFVALLGELIVNPLSATLLKVDPWIPIMVGMGLVFVGMLITTLMPETLELRRAADEELEQGLDRADGAEENGDADDGNKKTVFQRMAFSVKNDMIHIWRFLASSPGITMLISSFILSSIAKYAKLELYLQYVTKRFHWTWADATYVTTIGSVINLILILVILPGAGYLITRRYGRPALVKDLWLLRISGVFVILGCLLLAIAPTGWLNMAALVVFSLGGGFITLCRALMNAIIEPHTIATLNTVVGVLEMVSMLVGAPALSALLKIGFRLGGVWMGLPYLAATVLATLASVITFVYRLPTSPAQTNPT